MTFRVLVRVMPRAGLLDPEGQAVERALAELGFREAAEVRMGRAVELAVEAARRALNGQNTCAPKLLIGRQDKPVVWDANATKR